MIGPDDVRKQIVDVLVREIREHYRDDIAIAACYGSAITGTANPRSDIDFYFIPVSGRGYRMCIQFIIDDIGYDLWPLPWERAESIASLDQPLASIIADAQVVYHRNEADLQRFMGLKQTIEDAVHHENCDALMAKTDEILTRSKAQFFDAYSCVDDYSKVNAVCSGILEQLVTVVAYANSAWPRKGAANIRNEAGRWSRLPVDFVESYERIARSGDAREIIETTASIIKNVESLLHPEKSVEVTELTNDIIGGFYEEMKSTYNKLISACDAKDHIRAYFAANAIARETRCAFGSRCSGFSDLLVPISDDFERIRELAAAHELVMLDILRQNQIHINEFRNPDELADELVRRRTITRQPD